MNCELLHAIPIALFSSQPPYLRGSSPSADMREGSPSYEVTGTKPRQGSMVGKKQSRQPDPVFNLATVSVNPFK